MPQLTICRKAVEDPSVFRVIILRVPSADAARKRRKLRLLLQKIMMQRTMETTMRRWHSLLQAQRKLELVEPMPFQFLQKRTVPRWVESMLHYIPMLQLHVCANRFRATCQGPCGLKYRRGGHDARGGNGKYGKVGQNPRYFSKASLDHGGNGISPSYHPSSFLGTDIIEVL